MTPALDWIGTYGPAALAVWHGASPYTASYFFAAPWAVLPLIPMALLPYSIARWCLLITAICMFAYTAYRLGAKPLTMAFFLLSFPVLSDMANGNIEWMPMLGLVLPPRIGLIFVLIKPQVGIGIAIFWFIEAFREGGIRQVASTFLPVTLVILLSFAFYGFWPLNFLNTLALAEEISSQGVAYYNFSFWPYGLIVGLGLLIVSITKKEKRLSIMAGPFLSPYALLATYATSMLAWIDKPSIFFLIWLVTWIPFLFNLFSK